MRWFWLFVLVMLVSPSFAATQQLGPQGIGEGNILRGHFTQTRQMKGFGVPLRSEGDFVIAPPRGLVWNVKQPFATVTVITEKGIVQSADGETMTTLSAQKMPQLTQIYTMIGSMLKGDWNELEGLFTVRLTPQGGGWLAVLTPREDAQAASFPFQTIRAVGHRYVEKVVMIKTTGDSDEISFDHTSLSQKPLDQDETTLFALGEQ